MDSSSTTPNPEQRKPQNSEVVSLNEARTKKRELTRDQQAEMLSVALKYALRGWDTFPVPPGTRKSYKKRKASNGFKAWGKTRAPAVIRADRKQWPHANIGLPTGAEAGLVVIDVDTVEGHDRDGPKSLAELEARHGQLPPTLRATTPSGGLHYYFRHPGVKIKSTTSDIGDGLDVRGDGGMVLAVPSFTDKGAYRWVIEDAPIAEMPAWLIELCKDDEKNDWEGDDDPTADIKDVAAALVVIPNTGDDGWDDGWNRMGMAIYASTEAKGFNLFRAWSEKCPSKFDDDNTRKKWEAFHTCPPTRIGANYIFKLATAADPTWWADYMAQAIRAERREQQSADNAEIGNDKGDGENLPTVMTLDDMIERLVYAGEHSAVIDRATGRIRKRNDAGYEYASSIYKLKGKKPGKVIDVWIASPERITVDGITWWPGQPQICKLPESTGTAYNSWRGLMPMTAPENWRDRAQPFLDHVEYLVPIESERKTYLQWLAYITQRPEELPHTYYLMITPTAGIGRNLLSSIIVRVLRGYVATGLSVPEVLESPYNGRLSQKLLGIVDEAREGLSERRYAREQTLRKMITQETRLINPKFGVQSVEKNCCRWQMFSNHWDAVPFDNKDRRCATIANPTECRTPEYYTAMYALIEDQGFIASVRRLLETYDLNRRRRRL